MSCNPPTDRPVLCGKPRFVLAEAILLPPPLLLLRLVSSDLPPRLSKEGDGPERRGKWKGEDIPDNHTWASWRGKLAREIQSSTFSNLADGKLLSLHVFFCVFLLAEPTHIPLSMYAPPSRLTATSTVRNWVGRPTPKTHNTPPSPPPRKRGGKKEGLLLPSRFGLFFRRGFERDRFRGCLSVTQWSTPKKRGGREKGALKV